MLVVHTRLASYIIILQYCQKRDIILLYPKTLPIISYIISITSLQYCQNIDRNIALKSNPDYRYKILSFQYESPVGLLGVPSGSEIQSDRVALTFLTVSLMASLSVGIQSYYSTPILQHTITITTQYNYLRVL